MGPHTIAALLVILASVFLSGSLVQAQCPAGTIIDASVTQTVTGCNQPSTKFTVRNLPAGATLVMDQFEFGGLTVDSDCVGGAGVTIKNSRITGGITVSKDVGNCQLRIEQSTIDFGATDAQKAFILIDENANARDSGIFLVGTTVIGSGANAPRMLVQLLKGSSTVVDVDGLTMTAITGAIDNFAVVWFGPAVIASLNELTNVQVNVKNVDIDVDFVTTCSLLFARMSVKGGGFSSSAVNMSSRVSEARDSPFWYGPVVFYLVEEIDSFTVAIDNMALETASGSNAMQSFGIVQFQECVAMRNSNVFIMNSNVRCEDYWCYGVNLDKGVDKRRKVPFEVVGGAIHLDSVQFYGKSPGGTRIVQSRESDIRDADIRLSNTHVEIGQQSYQSFVVRIQQAILVNTSIRHENLTIEAVKEASFEFNVRMSGFGGSNITASGVEVSFKDYDFRCSGEGMLFTLPNEYYISTLMYFNSGTKWQDSTVSMEGVTVNASGGLGQPWQHTAGSSHPPFWATLLLRKHRVLWDVQRHPQFYLGHRCQSPARRSSATGGFPERTGDSPASLVLNLFQRATATDATSVCCGGGCEKRSTAARSTQRRSCTRETVLNAEDEQGEAFTPRRSKEAERRSKGEGRPRLYQASQAEDNGDWRRRQRSGREMKKRHPAHPCPVPVISNNKRKQQLCPFFGGQAKTVCE